MGSRVLLAIALAVSLGGAATHAKTLAPVTLQDPDGKRVALPDGRIWLLTFFYGSCEQTCPALLQGLSSLRERFKPEERRRLAFGAMTFDPAHDTPEHLARLADEFGLAVPGAAVMTGDATSVSVVLTTFDFTYRPDGDGGFDHANLFAVMNGKGKVVAHFYGVSPDAGRIVRTVRKLLDD
jgi:cytochrome oxidase Cu insertion factor (SCO1/SenC/PrrC family)